MKQIQWFPGHMAKSIRELKEVIKIVDVVMVLVDARIPYSSMNINLLKLTENKPLLLLLNKMDLADDNILDMWEKYYQDKSFHTLKINANKGINVNKILPKIKNAVLKDKIESRNKKGLITTSFKTVIIGIPNVGKSTLINRLVNKNVLKVENRAGVTKNLKWTRINENLELLDTPGILPPKLEENTKYNLAVFGAIKDENLPIDDVCIYLINYLRKYYPNRLSKVYGIDESLEIVDLLNSLCEKIGAIFKNKEYDYDRVYQMLLKDIRSNKLGDVCFERPDNI